MKTDRRTLIKASLAALLPLVLAERTEAVPAPLSDVSAIRIIQTKKPDTVLEHVAQPGFSTSLSASVQSFLAETYPKGKLPVWNKPLSQIDMGLRIPAIAAQVTKSVARHANIFPVDPCWIMGQMMAESFFHEFAISSALAVGPCQFISSTAKGYGLLCADARTVHSAPVKRLDLESAFAQASELRTRIGSLRRKHADLFRRPSKVLRAVLAAQTKGHTLKGSEAYGPALDLMDRLQSDYAQARTNYRHFLEENFKGRSIFVPQDVLFFEQFEQRVLYHHAIDAMVRMMAENLRARGGNILAATAGYNAGLGNTTYAAGVYATYGRIPNFGETVDYVSRILINHHEISRRI